jgi:hypothetical protein
LDVSPGFMAPSPSTCSPLSSGSAPRRAPSGMRLRIFSRTIRSNVLFNLMRSSATLLRAVSPSPTTAPNSRPSPIPSLTLASPLVVKPLFSQFYVVSTTATDTSVPSCHTRCPSPRSSKLARLFSWRNNRQKQCHQCCLHCSLG